MGVCSGSRLAANALGERGEGLEPEGGEIAAIEGFALCIGQRALVPTPGAKIHGLVFSLTRSELDRLYSEWSVQAYKPQAVLAHLASGGVVAALRYNLLTITGNPIVKTHRSSKCQNERRGRRRRDNERNRC